VGIGTKETDDVLQLVSRVKALLLAIVQQSRDFDAAYKPLLAMAYRLAKTDAKQHSAFSQTRRKQILIGTTPYY
jgi:hypothetical protein